MGLFSGKTKIYVASSVYNLAGDINNRPNYMKTTVIGGILNASNFSMGDVISNSYISGPGIRMRLFSSWSKNHFDEQIGLTSPTLNTLAKIDPELVKRSLPTKDGKVLYVQSADIGFGDFQEWCDQYIYENAPTRIDEQFEIDIDDETGVITMESQEGGSTIQFTPVNFEQGSRYLYVDYTYYSDPKEDPPVVGPLLTFSNESELPSTFFWSTVSEDFTPRSETLNTTVVVHSSFSDGRPDEETTTTDTDTQTWNDYIKVYKRGFNLSLTTAQVIIDNRVMTHTKLGTKKTGTNTVTEEIDLGGGVIETRVTTITGEYIEIEYTSQTVSTKTITDAAGEPHLFIYKEGSGNTELDSLFNTYSDDSRFYPFIPMRSDKTWIDRDEDMYPLCKTALRKATGGKLNKVLDTLKDNDDIDDIQYIYGAFGCALNTPEDTAKEYIFRFFEMAAEAFPADPNYPTMESIIQAYELANMDAEEYSQWWADNTSSSVVVSTPPNPPEYPVIPKREYRVRSSKGYKFDMTVEWNYIFETSHTGTAWEGAKKGELKTQMGETITLTRKSYRTNTQGDLVEYTSSKTMPAFEMLWQTGNDTYKKLTVYGLRHRNMVYKDKSVDSTAKEALDDADESGFLIPLHTNIYRSMSLVRSTQLSTACTYLVLNSYKKVKQKWYQSGAFKIAVIVVAIVISVASMGTGSAAGAGILGAYGSVGAALGFAGIAAIIVGAIANAVAAMVMMSILSAASTALFGDKLGIIVTAIASFVAMNVGTALSTGTSMSTMIANMANAQNLTMLTSSVGNGISQYINASTADTIRKTEEVLQQYNTYSKAIQSKYQEMFGTDGSGIIDPLSFIGIESLDCFTNRTLMTGSDIASLSMDMITNFADITTNIDLT